MTITLILLGIAIAAYIWKTTKPVSREEAIHRAQQAALKRHNRLVHGYWVERGKTIKPMDRTRYGAWVDETQNPT